MLARRNVQATLPAHDLERARQFYKDKLGLEPVRDTPAGLTYQTGEGAAFFLYETEYAGTAKNTAMSWETDDLDAEVEELRARGVEFEEYDLPSLKTENGIADIAGERAAWFKDSEGNILAISQSQ